MTRIAFGLFFIIGLSACKSPEEPLQFALIGDGPYSPLGEKVAERMIDDINARNGVEWVIHLGDVKGGSQSCDDVLLASRRTLFDGFEMPFILTPGDNDWFDCVREAAGSFDDYERLAFTRSLFFPDPALSTGQRPMALRSQALESDYSEYVENRMWEAGGAVFATVHLLAITRPPSDSTTAARRLSAAGDWVREAFRTARASGSAGVFLATQVDLWPVSAPREFQGEWCRLCGQPVPGLSPFYEVLSEEAASFEGQVVIAVGDTHVFRVDKPLPGPDGSILQNVTRVEGFGEPNLHWVRVEVDPAERQVFTFYQELLP
jgi:hypothetical protein